MFLSVIAPVVLASNPAALEDAGWSCGMTRVGWYTCEGVDEFQEVDAWAKAFFCDFPTSTDPDPALCAVSYTRTFDEQHVDWGTKVADRWMGAAQKRTRRRGRVEYLTEMDRWTPVSWHSYSRHHESEMYVGPVPGSGGLDHVVTIWLSGRDFLSTGAPFARAPYSATFDVGLANMDVTEAHAGDTVFGGRFKREEVVDAMIITGVAVLVVAVVVAGTYAAVASGAAAPEPSKPQPDEAPSPGWQYGGEVWCASSNRPAPIGPAAVCRDGCLSYSASRPGTCSSHGGVLTWTDVGLGLGW